MKHSRQNYPFDYLRQGSGILFKKNIKIGIIVFMISILLGTSVTVVYAAYASSNNRYYGPINGYEYYNCAIVYDDASATTWVLLDQTGQVPTGYMGARARLYTSDGTLREDSGWTYSDEPLAGWYVDTDTQIWSGTYYSQGYSAAYNGNGYNTYSTYRSPNITKS